jgi:uncharacterized RDD family membrane protein YckC
MQAAEARAAVHAAELATKAAMQAQAAAMAALEGLQTASSLQPLPETDLGPVVGPERAPEQTNQPTVELEEPLSSQAQASVSVRWEPGLPVRDAEPVTLRESRGLEDHEASVENSLQPLSLGRDPLGTEALEPVEPDQPIHANLIEFPRELVAAHKARPRLADGRSTAVNEPVGQLSIFEVDPTAISTTDATEAVTAEPAAFEWSGIELDAHPLEDMDSQPEPAPATPALHLAPFSRRLLAALVDGALITSAFLAAVMVAVSNIDHLPAIKLFEIGAGAALLITGLLYQILFSTLAEATPGMKYARVSLCTFDDQSPTCAQRCDRLSALILSVLPVGLGLAWSIFDEEHLSWHDRLSRTYLRKSGL